MSGKHKPYIEGIAAANFYSDAIDVPTCPYLEGTQEGSEWNRGYGDGLDDIEWANNV